MILNPNIFREYDLRGEADIDLPDGVAKCLGQAYGTLLKGALVVVGRDNRLSSLRIHTSVIQGLQASGSRVIDIGEVTTPIFYFARTYLKIEGGLMITASHNPAPQNGLKICRGEHTMCGPEIQDFRHLAESGNFLTGRGTVEIMDMWPAYLEMMQQKIKLAQPLKVVVDCGNGVLGKFAPSILRAWGCEVIEMYCEPDGRFPNHEPDPTKEKNIRELMARVVAEKANLGLGFDGDADRLGVVAENGQLISGDKLLILFFRELLIKHPAAICLIEIKCSQALIDDVVAYNGQPILCRTGHSLIKAKMLELNALVAGEMSGHMFFRDEFTGADDALYAAGRLMRIMTRANKPLSDLLLDIPKYYSSPELHAFCPDDKKFDVVAAIREKWRSQYEKIIDIDGVRVPFLDGWILARASNTQPALIVRAEGKTLELKDKYLKIIQETLAAYPEIKWEL